MLLVVIDRCFQLRKVAACEAALERVVLEADEALVNHGQMARTGSDQVWTVTNGLVFSIVCIDCFPPRGCLLVHACTGILLMPLETLLSAVG